MKLFLILFLVLFPLFTPLCPADTEAQEVIVPVIDLDVSINFDASTVHGTATVLIPEIRRLDFSLAGLDVSSVSLNGHELSGAVGEDGMLHIGPLNNSRTLVISFSKKAPLEGGMPANFISGDRAVLLHAWYPSYQGLARYNLRVTVPQGITAVSEADSTDTSISDGSAISVFHFPYPRKEVTLVAAPFVKSSEEYKGIRVETYFFKQDSALARRYSSKIKEYIDLYSEILTPYPFKRFAVVENMLPTGYGMATYTLLGSQVVRLPFIADTSLGHEFVHSWFGNSVYVDSSQGNWCEGLTTMLSDALYRELKDEGAAWRHETLVEYQSWIHPDNAFPVSEFRSGTDRVKRAVGYGKVAMIFHMLKKEVGERAFRRSLKRLVRNYSFQEVSWSDIADIFEKETQRDLGWFFDQWLKRRDVAELEFSKVRVEDENGRKKRISLIITQKSAQPYRVTVPLLIALPGKDIVRKVDIADRVTEINFTLPAKPYGITADPDFDIMRRLEAIEFPPVLSRVFGAEKKFYSVSDKEKELYAPIVSFLESRGFKLKKSGEGHGHEGFSHGAFIILGKATGGMKMLTQDDTPPESGVSVKVSASPFGPGSIVCVVEASSADELQAIVHKLPHYGKYSTLQFEKGKIMEKSVTPAASGVRLEISRGITAIAARDIFPIKKIARYISGDRVVYVSEQHDLAAHHRAQLEIIKLLHSRGVKLAVGMEMFQRPYQPVLDDYIAGKIDEREFLRQSQYFRRWGFDYNLYRPIIEFCRKNSIPVVALNLRKEISKKIARVGIDALTADERSAIPEDMDMSNRQYRAHLRDIFSEHSASSLGNFDYFFQAQISWDETMAKSVASYLQSHPNRTMVVIAGVGHIAYAYGIPARVARRMPGVEYSIIINDPGEDMVPEAGDFFLFPPAEEAKGSPKLGVGLSDDNGTLLVKSVMPGSPAAKGGLKAGDVIVEFDGHPINDLNDLKTELFFKKLGDRVRVKVLRDGSEVTVKTGKFTSTSFSFGNPHGSGMHGAGMMKKMHVMKGMKQKKAELDKREREEAEEKKP